ncbi:unnamed protein product [Owenia fusiformis]|uniref:Uncharacterized protein n=1 Tax=Owenia fusiformis TaxID=6347 RepID=A0A8J1XKW8_OWEFU|nr:unnamed protein product [Owenia fusiformis]
MSMMMKTGGSLAICMIAVIVGLLQRASADDTTTAARDPYQTCGDSTTCTCAPVINVTPPQLGYCDCKNLTKWLSTTASGQSETKENIAELATDVANLRGSVDELKATSHDESDFVNYYDELAQATCTAMNPNTGWTYAVRRRCGDRGNGRACDAICQDPQLRAQDSQLASRSMACFNSLHVYWDRPKFAHGEAGYEKLGLKIYKLNNCIQQDCGPNYCCCRS